jgi:hypothetical protein
MRYLKQKSEEATIEHFKDLVTELVEKPMFINADLISGNLLSPNASLLHLVIKQPGIYEM